MPEHRVCFGPPGTGKTTAGIGLAKDWFKSLSGEQVAYLAFTKAAAREAVGRILDEEMVSNEKIKETAPFFRTIHSLCYMGLRAERDDVRLVTTADMKKFSRQTGWEAIFGVHDWEDLAEVYQRMQNQGRSDWDRALMAYTLSRLTSSSVDELAQAQFYMSRLAQETVGHLGEDQYQVFTRKYEEYKAQERLVDFTDMLAWGLTGMQPLDGVRKVVIDEAQDLCPLHHAIMERLFEQSEEMWWMGDDDQAIYRWSGASAELFLERAWSASVRIQLRQTHRFGQEIVDFSNRIIRRVSVREPKDIIGVMGREGTAGRTGSFAPTSDHMLILHRHVQGCQTIAQMFMEEGIPFSNERGRDPLSAKNRIRSWQTMDDLARGDNTSWGGIRVLFEDEVPSTTIREHRDGTREKVRLMVHGAKTKLPNIHRDTANVEDLLELKVVTKEGAKAIRERSHALFKHPDDFDYYHRVVEKGHDLDSDKIPVITTIHGSKGRQAPRAVLFSEMSRKCWIDRDSEHRLAYVAATRTQGSIDVCDLGLVDWAPTAYDYPVEKEGDAA